jgi:hypothetical protein
MAVMTTVQREALTDRLPEHHPHHAVQPSGDTLGLIQRGYGTGPSVSVYGHHVPSLCWHMGFVPSPRDIEPLPAIWQLWQLGTVL